MPDNHPLVLKADAPIESADEDRLGFNAIAQRVANSVIANGSQAGLTIGVHGEWGSGKSSLLALIRNTLRSLPDSERPSIITFSPWLIGNRDALIANMFAELKREIASAKWLQGDATEITNQKLGKAISALEAFLKGISKAGSVIEVVGSVTGWVPVELTGKVVKSLDIKKREDPSISTLKTTLENSLSSLDHRFIVIIDDIDRLDPGEATEILRLVRSIGNLPNVSYILSYEPEILASAVERTLGVSNGGAYLEKIVHLPVGVPQPEELQLRNWFAQDLNQIAVAKNDDEASRLRTVIDQEGNRHLRTPRSVQRALNRIRFLWPTIRDAQADLADLVWLQLIKERNPRLHNWIERYCATAAIVALNAARVDEAETQKFQDELAAAVQDGRFSDTMARFVFSEILPSIATDSHGDARKFELFKKQTSDSFTAAIRCKRLSSPDHYRIYFALDSPSFALQDTELRTIISAAEDGSEMVGKELVRLHSEMATERISKTELLLDRLRDRKYLRLSHRQNINLTKALSDFLDEARSIRPFNEYFIETIWDKSERVLSTLLGELTADQRKQVIRYIPSSGRAIGWLTSLYRRETFAHGKFGRRPEPSSEWILTEAEYEDFSRAMTARYRQLSHSDWLALPD